jgi:hypothetical protein
MRALVGLLAAISCLAMLAPGVNATPTAQTFLNAVYADVRDSGSPGLILVDAIGSQTARLTVALGGLLPGHSYRVVFGTRRCFDSNTPANRIVRVNLGEADDSGAIFKTVSFATDGGAWRNAWSMRLMEEEGIFYYCQTPNRLDRPGTAQVDGAFGRYQRNSRLAVAVTMGNDSASFDVALGGLAPGARYRLVHSPLTCAEFTEGDPDQPVIVGSIRADSAGMAFKADPAPTTTAPTDVTAGSLRVERRGNGSLWGCLNQHAFTLFLPPG